MKTHLTLLSLLINMLVVNAEESTFEKVLGADKVKLIVNEAAVELMAEKHEKYPKVIVEPLLYEKVVVLAGAARVTLNNVEKYYDPSTRLKKGVNSFFKDYRDFVGERQKPSEALILGIKQLADFLGWFKTNKGCGKIPCDIPPCCGNCDDCAPAR